jgi:ADP-ribose pyrophosphatase YjhB (NUDIX family)
VADDILLVAALLRRDGELLLVRQLGSGDLRAAWTLPGGIVEPDELLVESLVRAVREETGIEVVRVGDLIHVAQRHIPTEHVLSAGELAPAGWRATAFVFEVAEWKGELHATDPDEFGREARFWPRNESIRLLEDHPSRGISEPILAYLRGEERDRVWLYRRGDDGQDQLEWPTREPAPEISEQMKRARALVVLGCMVILAVLIIIVIIGVITLARPFM